MEPGETAEKESKASIRNAPEAGRFAAFGKGNKEGRNMKDRIILFSPGLLAGSARYFKSVLVPKHRYFFSWLLPVWRTGSRATFPKDGCFIWTKKNKFKVGPLYSLWNIVRKQR